jgi:acyl-CoA thioesterase-1
MKECFFLLVAILVLFSCKNNTGEETMKNSSSSTSKKTENRSEVRRKTIVFFGNSLTAAYGINPEDGYIALLQQRLDSMGFDYKTVNAGLSGETTAGGKERVNWILRQPVDIFLLELGGNDALRGISPSASYNNLDSIILIVKAKYPEAKIILAGMEAPPNMGSRYTSAFRENYSKLAQLHGISLIPFFLEGVGGVPELNQSDRIHPNEEGQKILVENVWKVLEPLLAR